MARPEISLDGRTFRPTRLDGPGEVDGGTVFYFHQEGDMVWAAYLGGRIRRGFLVGTISDQTLVFRYAQLSQDGQTATGRSTDAIEQLPDGRLRLHEQWVWDSKAGAGTSTLEEQ